MSEQLYIVIVDNDRQWRESIKQELLNKGILMVEAYADCDEAVTAIAQNPPVHLLIDYSLCNANESLDFLSRLADQGMRQTDQDNDCNIWIVSDYPSLDINPLKLRVPAVHRFWFAKPLKTVDGILAKFALAEKIRKFSETLCIPINDIPWPVRIFNEQGHPVAVNESWLIASNRPVPPELKQLRQTTGTSLHWGALPGKHQTDEFSSTSLKPEYGFFNLCTFEFSEHFKQKLYGQLCDELPHRQQTLPQLIERCFEALRQTGFTEVEFYRLTPMPGSLGVLQRMNSLGNLDFPRLIEKKLYKRLKRRFLDKKNPIPSGELLYEWVDNNECLLTMSQMRPPYAKAPLLCNSLWSGDNSLWLGDENVAALILFKQNDATIESTEDKIKPIKTLLLALFDHIAKRFRQEAEDDRIKRWKQIDDYEKKIALCKNIKNMEEQLLDAAMAITKASAGYFVGKTLDNITLPVRAADGYRKMIPKNIPLSEEHFPEIRCWKHKRSYFIHHYQRLHFKQKLTLKDCQVILDDKKQAEDLFKLLDSERGSVCALPILSGESMLGVLVLESENAFHFTQAQAVTVHQLLQRARWHLNAVVEAEHRRQWEHVLMHELLTGILVIGNAVDSIGEFEIEVNTKDDLLTIERHQLSLLDLANDFFVMQGRHEHDLNAYFTNPRLAIEKFCELYSEQIKDSHKLKIILQPENEHDNIWQVPLKSDFAVFSRVVRNLLHNAMKFSEKNSEINITATREEYFWKLTVSNSGQIPPEELRQCFIPFAKSETVQAKRVGSHIGLAANRELVQQIDGTLTLSNDSKRGLVVAELCWPLYIGI